MPLTEPRDFVLSKNAYYFDERSVQQSGCLVVTANRIMLNVIQAVNPLPDYDADLSSLKNSIQKLKKDFKAIGEYGRRKKEILYFAASSGSIEEFEQKVIARGSFNAQSIHIPWNEVASYSTGLFFGFKLKLGNGHTCSISTMKLGKIKKFLAGHAAAVAKHA